MPTTQSEDYWVVARPARPELAETPDAQTPDAQTPDATLDHTGAETPARERDARHEIDRLREEIEQLVRTRNTGENARETLDSALESVTRLQIVTANIDACGPPPAAWAGAAAVALADSHLRGHSDAIERGMTYTADNQLRLLLQK